MSGREVLVIGAGGHAKVVIGAIEAGGDRVVAALDDDARRWGSTILGVRIAGPVATAPSYGVPTVIAIGGNATRARLGRAIDVPWATVVHPRAWVHPSVVLGPGTVVFAGAMIQPDSRLGHHCIVNTGATIDHDGALGDCVHVAPGAHLAGTVTIGEESFLGVGVAVIPGITIGARTTVGAGAAVVRDLPDGVVAVGVPARVVRPAG